MYSNKKRFKQFKAGATNRSTHFRPVFSHNPSCNLHHCMCMGPKQHTENNPPNPVILDSYTGSYWALPAQSLSLGATASLLHKTFHFGFWTFKWTLQNCTQFFGSPPWLTFYQSHWWTFRLSYWKHTARWSTHKIWGFPRFLSLHEAHIRLSPLHVGF